MYATLEDIATRMGRELTPVEAGTVELLLEGATDLILQEVQGSELEWVLDPEAPPDPPRAVRGVCIEAVYRAVTNPEAAAAMSAGDLSISYARQVAEEALYLTRAERRQVRVAAGIASFRSVTLETPYSGTVEDVLDVL